MRTAAAATLRRWAVGFVLPTRKQPSASLVTRRHISSFSSKAVLNAPLTSKNRLMVVPSGSRFPSRNIHLERTLRQKLSASEIQRPPTLYSATDLPVLEAKELMLSTVMEMDFGVPRAREMLEALREALEYTLHGRNRPRLLGVLQTYQLLAEEPDRNLPDAAMVAWCVEMLECCQILVDDMIDGSPVRRGRPAAHTRPDIGRRAIVDAIIFEKAVSFVLKRRLQSHPVLPALLDLFDDCDLRAMLGQMFDVLSTATINGGQQLRQPSFDRYWSVGMLKSGPFTLQLPVRAGMYMAGVVDKAVHKKAHEACTALGQIYMVHNDFNDWHSCPEVMGRVGTDIVEHKHTWFLITALKLASPEQVQIIKAHIGRGVPGGPDEAAVKAVYNELNLQDHYVEYREQALRDFEAQLALMPPNLAEALRLQRDILMGPDT
ncbi:farnesyl pyrophosphate synthase-like isoform X2 [Haemaphysalis longicornis]